MSKTIRFFVELEFSEKIVNDNEIQEIADNIGNALVHAVNTAGLAPEISDGYTEHIRITEQFSGAKFTHSF